MDARHTAGEVPVESEQLRGAPASVELALGKIDLGLVRCAQQKASGIAQVRLSKRDRRRATARESCNVRLGSGRGQRMFL